MKSHLKRLAMPRSWDVKRKKTVFIMRPHPGGSSKEFTMPLQILLRDILKVAKTAKEVMFILKNKEVIVNSKRRKEPKFPVSLMDIVEIPELKATYRMLIGSKRKLFPSIVKDGNIKLFNIKGKTSTKKGTQLNFTDGTNMIVKEDSYKTGDLVVYDLVKKKITKHVAFDKGSAALLIGGKNIGAVGKIQDIKERNIILKTDEGEFETSRRYAFIVGKDKPVIDLP